MSNGKQLIRCSRSDIDAVVDMAIDWPDTFKTTVLDVARPALAVLVSRIPAEQIMALVLAHPHRRLLLSHLAVVYRHSTQDLRHVAQLILKHEDKFCESGRESFADEYWMIELKSPAISDGDWQRAYDMIRFASRGVEALQDKGAMPAWIADEPIGLRCSRRGTERLVEELHAALRVRKLVSDVMFEDVPLVFKYPNPNTIPGMILAKAIGGHDPQLGFSHIGAMVVSIAGYLDRVHNA